MARVFLRRESGASDGRIKWAVEQGRLIRLERGVYFEGDRPPLPFERRLAKAMRGNQPVTGELSAALHGMDGFDAPKDGCYRNIAKVNAHETLLAIAATTADIKWEQALEWCLRNHETSVGAITAELATHRRGNGRMKRVLHLRPEGAPPTGSILETMAVQLIRSNQTLPTPKRQVHVGHWYLDLAWPEHGVFLELDGEWHKDQPQYGATRQTAVIAMTGWLVGRYTWTDIERYPNNTLRSLAMLHRQVN